MNFKQLKQAVPIVNVLEHYGVFAGLKERGKSYRGDCPFCGSNDDAPFSVSLEKNCFNAFCCSKHGNILDFVAEKEGLSIKKAAEFLNNIFQVEKTPTKKEEKQSTVKVDKTDQPAESSENTNEPLAFTLNDIDPAHSNVGKLGLSEETARSFSAGFYSGRGMLKDKFVMPVYSYKGDLIAYTGIDLDHPNTPIYPPKFIREVELFARYCLCDREPSDVPLILSRHPLDVLALTQAGYESVALMGEEITEEQVKLMNRSCGASRKIILFLSTEDQGAVETLSKLIPFFYIRMVRYEHDPDNPTVFAGEILELLEI